MPDPFSCEVLEFTGILELLRGFLTGPLAEPLAMSLEPGRELELIRRDLELVREAGEFLLESARPSFSALVDPRALLEKLSIQGVALEPKEILALVEAARAACDLRGLFASGPFTQLDGLVNGVADFRPLVKELDDKILPDGTIDSSASKELARIRRASKRLSGEVHSALEKLVRQFSHEEVLQDAVVTLRNERFVIPVRAEEKRRVGGVIHGTSSSGATVFIEPFETVPLNNELVELGEREFAEVQRILAEFSALLRGQQAELSAAVEALSELDLAFAKAGFARAYDCTLPEFLPSHELALIDLRHPLLEKTLRAQKRTSVPMTIEMRSPKTLMIVSGPNTGGKTVALKSIGMAALMAQSGLPVAAREARLPLFRRVLVDIGDQQSIQASLSTFSAHIANIQSMVEVAGQDDLVLLDEIGASTEPNEGAALAVAILEHFRGRGAVTFVTTHHSRLKAYAAETPQAVNAAMEFDQATLQPTYRLISGLPGKSSGIDTAARLGLEPEIVQKARALLAPAEAEGAALIATLHDQAAMLEVRLREIDQEIQAYDARRAELERHFEEDRGKKLKELDHRLEETIKQYAAKWEEALKEVRAQALAGGKPPSLGRKVERQAASLASAARQEWDAQVLETLGAPAAGETQAPTKAPPAVGDHVRVANLSTPGTVTALLGGDQLELEVGRLRMRVRTGEVSVLAQPPAGAPVAVGKNPSALMEKQLAGLGQNSPSMPSAEINVIGTTADEAQELVDKFLDSSFVAGKFRLRVIHGHGKGILMRVLREMFASHPHVERFYPAPQNEGGAGATIVELRL